MPYQSIDKTEVEGVFKVQPKVFGDPRGPYCPNVEVSEFKDATGIDLRSFTQIATSLNYKFGVLRGMHYQLAPETQGKLVMAVQGSVLDVALDVRHNSPTFGKFVAEVLSAKDQNQLWVPAGCAHGYLALEPNSQFLYLVTDGKYTPALERGVNPLDSHINIPWGMSRGLMDLNTRDLSSRNLKDIPSNELL